MGQILSNFVGLLRGSIYKYELSLVVFKRFCGLCQVGHACKNLAFTGKQYDFYVIKVQYVDGLKRETGKLIQIRVKK